MKKIRLAAIALFLVMTCLLSACGKADFATSTAEKTETAEAETLPDTSLESSVNTTDPATASTVEQRNPSDTSETTTAENTTVASTTAPPATTVHTHAFHGASCTAGGKCACGQESNPRGHDYTAATCAAPQTCRRCGATGGAALGHNYSKGRCTRCGDTNGPLNPADAWLFNNRLSDAENAEALAVARSIAAQVNAKYPSGLDLERVGYAAQLVSQEYRKGVHVESGDYYHTAYGVFVKRESSCAGCTRALGLVLSCMGYQWSHVNENQWAHQWLSVTMDGQTGYADGQVGLCGYGAHPFAWSND